MSKPVITVENLSKAYRIGLKEEVPDTLMSAMTGFMKAPLKKFHELRRLNTFGHAGGQEDDLYWALKDVSFEVQEGEVLGVIGRNGAGKSTLLKILSRITEPTSGRAVIRGRVSSLLEVGTGFHPELSGRENVYLNGTILGMTKREIDSKFDEIVDFSGVEKFLDTPIKRYSSGMKVRLAFAVAAHLEPEILIIDEVLAVGDAEFQKKCMGKMQDVARGGRTVLFVSHNLPALRALISHGMVLGTGSRQFYGTGDDSIEYYLQTLVAKPAQNVVQDLDDFRRPRSPGAPATIEKVWFSSDGCVETKSIAFGHDFTLNIAISAVRPLEPVCVSFRLLNGRYETAVIVSTVDHEFRAKLDPGVTVLTCVVKGLPLSPGRYVAQVGVTSQPNAQAYDVIKDLPAFEVVLPGIESGVVPWAHREWGGVHWMDAAWAYSD